MTAPVFLVYATSGSVGDHFTNSPAGSSLAFSGQLATKHSIAATEVRLCDGHIGTKGTNDYSCRAWLFPACDIPCWPARFPFHSATGTVAKALW
jgi:hypothetical protein